MQVQSNYILGDYSGIFPRLKTKSDKLARIVVGSRFAIDTNENAIRGWSPLLLKSVVFTPSEYTTPEGKVLRCVTSFATLYMQTKNSNNYQSEGETMDTISTTVLYEDAAELFRAWRKVFQARKYQALRAFIYSDDLLSGYPSPVSVFEALKGTVANSNIKGLAYFGGVNTSALWAYIQGSISLTDLTAYGLTYVSSREIRSNDLIFQPSIYMPDTHLKSFFQANLDAINNDKEVGTVEVNDDFTEEFRLPDLEDDDFPDDDYSTDDYSGSLDLSDFGEDDIYPDFEGGDPESVEEFQDKLDEFEQAITEDEYDWEGDEEDEEEEVEEEDFFTETLKDMDRQAKELDEEFLEEVYTNLFRPTVRAVISDILEQYDKIFESGFQLKRPKGVLSDKGEMFYVDNGVLKKSRFDAFVRESSELIIPQMNLTVCQHRSSTDIANIIINKKDSMGTSYEGRLYFPMKMVEFAYGCVKPVDIYDSKTFSQSTHAGNWSKYKANEIQPSLEMIFREVVKLLLNNNSDTGRENEKYIKGIIESLKDTFTTCILIAEHNPQTPDIFKVKVLDPYESLDGGTNISTDIVKSAQLTEGGVNSVSQAPVVKGIYKEFTHEINHTLYNAEPIFAYKALQSYMAQGKKPGFENMLIGLRDGDKIMPVGKDGIDFTRTLLHYILAGSRSGKGLQMLNISANAIMSGYPIFYLDNKPDTSSLLKSLSSNMFAINGNNYAYNKEAGTDYFNQFSYLNDHSDNSIFKKYKGTLIPNYVDEFYNATNQSLGGMIYLKAYLFTLAILKLRVENSEFIDELGGSKGIIVVVDEINNTIKGLESFMNKLYKSSVAGKYINALGEHRVKLARYNKDLVQWELDGGKGRKPKEPKIENLGEPTVLAVWNTTFYNKLKSSIDTMLDLSRAGLRNSESKLSNIFIIGQESFEGIPSSKLSKVFRTQNATQNIFSATADDVFGGKYLQALLSFDDVDGLVGYNDKQKGLLAQQDKRSNAYGKLDSTARNFGYIDSVLGSNLQGLGYGNSNIMAGIDLSKRVNYYKPFLILPTSNPNDYFLKNTMDYISKAGLEVEDVISRNSVENDPNTIHPAVGFKEYLNMAGVTDQEIERVLNQSGEIAQRVVDKIGYKGTWHEFIYDLRPEWMWSIQDLVDAYVNGGFTDVERRLIEFSEIHPKVVGAKKKGTELEEMGIESDEDLEVASKDIDSRTFFEAGALDKIDSSDESFELPSIAELNAETSYTNNINGDTVSSRFGDINESINSMKEAPQSNIQVSNLTFDRTSSGLLNFCKYITKEISKTFMAEYGTEKVEFSAGRLLFDGTLVTMSLDQATLDCLPPLYARRAQMNLWAEFFDWNELNNYANLEEIHVTSDDLRIARKWLGVSDLSKLPKYFKGKAIFINGNQISQNAYEAGYFKAGSNVEYASTTEGFFNNAPFKFAGKSAKWTKNQLSDKELDGVWKVGALAVGTLGVISGSIFGFGAKAAKSIWGKIWN